MALVSGARLGPYEILSPLGAGGMGEVYRARDDRLGRDVAIKVLPPELTEDPERLKRFEREARATAALSHPNILAIYDVGRYDGVPYLVEELLEGESLKDRLDRGPLDATEATRLALDMAKGLAAAHEKGLIHRDLKPGNVFLTRDGTVKLLDFGLAKRLPRASETDETLTQAQTATTAAGGVLGTMAYMAPEQLRGQRVDQRADVFAFGVVLYELLAGQRPFRGATATDTVVAILESTPAALPAGVPAALATVVARCLEKDPERRYQRGSEVRAALEAVQSGSVVPGPSWLTRRRLRRAAAAAALVAVALVAAVIGDLGGLRDRLLRPAGAPSIQSLAVLPLANLSGDPAQEYFADGMTEELITSLAKIGALKVISRTSVMQYKGTTKPLPQIARELNVDALIEGSVLREGGQVRITAQLIQAATDQHLWAESYQRDLRGVLALQAEIASAIADQVRAAVTPAERARLASAQPVDPEAFEAYIKGSQHWIKMTKADVDTAEGYFTIAIEKDPSYAPAYAGMAWVWALRGQQGWAPPAEAVRKQREATLKALSLDPTLAEAHYLLAIDKTWGDRDIAAADREWGRAVELDPGYADGLAMYSHYLMIMRRPEEAMAQIDRALRLDPFNETIHSFRAIDLLYVRRFDEAIVEARKAVDLAPGNFVALPAMYLALAAKGSHTEAVDAMKAYVVAIGLPDVARALDRGFMEDGFARAAKRGAEAFAAHVAQGTAGALPTDVAQFYILAGEKLHALDWLERADQTRDPNTLYLGLPVYDLLRSEPRFQALLRRMNLPQ